ncbi:beta-1,3-galactosyltransferase pvg3-like [Typha latifolia]|uniref:beta-1,3-galactosyltransferase pvg3-like n=1 Tax=Typha latifolia TaxID=4733 RepID=UPI003C2F3489
MKNPNYFIPKIYPPAILLLLPPLLVAITYLVPPPNDFQLPFNFSSCRRTTVASDSVIPATVNPDFRLLIGILTLPGRYERRHLLRLAYSLQPSHTAHIDVRFIFCNLRNEEDIILVALEIMRYDDIIILNCTESMNTGKTYTYFSSLPTIFDAVGDAKSRPYDYVMKTDDDTYFRLDNLVESLRHKHKEDMYFGAALPFYKKDSPEFMLGMGYILSWDLVEWISTSEIARNNANGPEDMLTGKWLNIGRKAKNRYSTTPAMYDYKGSNPEDFVTPTIAVHQLKDNLRWTKTLKHFNVTDGMKPSKFYHIP